MASHARLESSRQSRQSGSAALLIASIIAIVVCGVAVWWLLRPGPGGSGPIASPQAASRSATTGSEPEGGERGERASSTASESAASSASSSGAESTDTAAPEAREVRVFGKVTRTDGSPVRDARILWVATNVRELEPFRHDLALLTLEVPPELLPAGAPDPAKVRHIETRSADDGTYELAGLPNTRTGTLIALEAEVGHAIVGLDLEKHSDGQPSPPTAVLEAPATLEAPSTVEVTSADSSPRDHPADGESASFETAVASKESTIDLASSERELDLVLTRSTRISGRVVAKRTGDPAAGMEIHAYLRDSTQAPMMGIAFGAESGDGPRAVAGEDGRYAFAGLEPGSYAIVPRTGASDFVSVSARRGTSISLEPSQQVEDVDFEVELGGSLVVAVTAPDGRPRAGSKVNVMPADVISLATSGEIDIFARGDELETNPDGTAVLRGLPLDHGYRVLVADDELAASMSDEVELTRERPNREVVVRLEHAFAIRGYVEHEDGSPAANVRVWAQPVGGESEGANVFVAMGGMKSEESDADGSFRIAGLGRGKYRVTAGGAPFAFPGAEAGSDPIEVEIAGADVTGVVLQIATRPQEATSSISGRVVDDLGQPVADARVSAKRSDSVVAVPAAAKSTTSTADGSFVFSNLAEGSYKLDAVSQLNGKAELPDPVATGTEGVVLVVPRNGRVEGRVVDGQGRPVGPGGEVTWRGTGKETSLIQRLTAFGGDRQPSKSLDADGRFGIDVAPGKVEILVVAPGYAPATSGELRIEPGELEDDVEIIATRGATVAGRVTAIGPAGVPQALVTLRAIEDDESSEAVRRLLPDVFDDGVERATTAASGDFVFEHLAPGRYAVRAQHEEWAPSDEQRITLELDEERDVGALILRQGARIDGRVVVGEKPGVGYLVQIYGGSDPIRQLTSGSDGTFEVKHLSSGTYTLMAMDAAGMTQGKFRFRSVQVTVATGDVRDVELVFGNGYRVYGKVEGSTGGTTTMVTLRRKGGPAPEEIDPTDPAAGLASQAYQAGMAMIGPGGTFEIQDIEPGEYFIEVPRMPSDITDLEAYSKMDRTPRFRKEIRVIDREVEVEAKIEQ